MFHPFHLGFGQHSAPIRTIIIFILHTIVGLAVAVVPLLLAVVIVIPVVKAVPVSSSTDIEEDDMTHDADSRYNN
jgi:hypothetical protein